MKYSSIILILAAFALEMLDKGTREDLTRAANS
jgi:hypothetical protein